MSNGSYTRFRSFLRKWWELHLPLATSSGFIVDKKSARVNLVHLALPHPSDSRMLFLRLQCSVKPGESGRFTIDVLAKRATDAQLLGGVAGGSPTEMPRPQVKVHGTLPARRAMFEGGGEGSWRLGKLVHGKDKWWNIAPIHQIGRPHPLRGVGSPPRALKPRSGIEWTPSSYDDETLAFAEAAADITKDVHRLIDMFFQPRRG